MLEVLIDATQQVLAFLLIATVIDHYTKYHQEED